MPHLFRDLRFAWRQLRRHAGFTAVAVLALALGIAATTAIFSVVYATFLAPLPYREPDRLVRVFSRLDGKRRLSDAGDFVEGRRRATAFEDLNAWTLTDVTLAGGDRPEHVEAVLTTPGLMRMLGQERRLEHGRDFLDEEERWGCRRNTRVWQACGSRVWAVLDDPHEQSTKRMPPLAGSRRRAAARAAVPRRAEVAAILQEGTMPARIERAAGARRSMSDLAPSCAHDLTDQLVSRGQKLRDEAKHLVEGAVSALAGSA